MPDHAPCIFISYRGSDERWAPDVIYQGLVNEFGPDAVFKAGYNLRPGDIYPQLLKNMARSCRVMLVCIGPRWLEARDAAGGRRLEKQDDWVHKEIELALSSGNHVIPLLLGNADEVIVPAPEELPEDIAQLVCRQAFRMEPGGRLRMTLPELVTRLTELVPSLALQQPTTVQTSVRQKVGHLTGRMTGALAPRELTKPIIITQEIDTVGRTGNAVGLDLSGPSENLLHRQRGRPEPRRRQQHERIRVHAVLLST